MSLYACSFPFLADLEDIYFQFLSSCARAAGSEQETMNRKKTRSATAAQAGADLAIVQSAVRVVLRCVLAVFVLEVAISAGRDALGLPPGPWFSIVRALLLSVLLLPVFFPMVLRPVAELAAKQAAAAAEARFQAVANSAHDGIVIFAADTKILFANASAERLHGYEAGSLQGRSLESLMPEDTRKAFREDFAAFLRSREAKVVGKGPCEHAGLRTNGERFPVEISVSELKADGGNQFVVVMREISARKTAEREIQERTTRLNALIANSPLAIVLLDKNQRVQMCNAAFEQLFQYHSAEIAGMELDGLVAPQERMAEALEMTKQGMQGQAVHAIAQRRRKDGSLVDVEIHGVPLLIAGQMEGTYAIYQDITERKKLNLYEQILPVCCVCGKIRDDEGAAPGEGDWDRLDHYITKHSDAKLSHTFCPPCLEEYRKREGLT